MEPSPVPGPPATKGALLERWLPDRLESDPDPMLEERCQVLDEAISKAMSAVTLEEVAGWFSHCGYEPRDQYS